MSVGRVKLHHPLALVLGGLVVAAFPWLPFVSFSVLGSANLAAYYAVVAVSLVVITGWVGQISLGHAGLVGIGAYVSGHVVNGWGITYPVNILWAALAGALVAAMLGVVAVRVRGLYLAVATLIFSWTAVEFLFRQEWFTRNASITVASFGEPGTWPHFDFTSRRTFFYAAWATVIASVYLMSNLRDSKTGRAFFAVRGSEVAAASMGISVVGTKLLAFAVSGALAGVAGNLLLVRDQIVTSDAFKVDVSLFFLAIAVVGGLSSLGGAIAAAILFASLNELFFRLQVLSGWLEVVPPLLLTLVLLLYRGGLAAIPSALDRRCGGAIRTYLTWFSADLVALRQRWVGVRARDEAALPEATLEKGRIDLAQLITPRRSSLESAHLQEAPTMEPLPVWRELTTDQRVLPRDREDRAIVVDARGVTVRFGGLTAVDEVSLSVREHEIVGLIGPNGAGKTTTFNSIAGLNQPTAGTVEIFGQDVTTWSVDARARLGVGRTFQAVQLLPQLTVFDNLLVATHLQNRSGLLSHLFVGPATLRAERVAREQVHRAAALLELEGVLDRAVADLPFGQLRMVELARALVTGSSLIMLDEPASGLDSAETERLTAILRVLRDLGLTLLLIEHDVRMVTACSDYIYVLDRGAIISEGAPADVQRDPQVIAAYLGAPEPVDADAAQLAEVGS